MNRRPRLYVACEMKPIGEGVFRCSRCGRRLRDPALDADTIGDLSIPCVIQASDAELAFVGVTSAFRVVRSVIRAWVERPVLWVKRVGRFLRELLYFVRFMIENRGRGFLVGEQYDTRVLECRKCEKRKGNVCTICGCRLEGATLAKLRWATAECPLDSPRWGRVIEPTYTITQVLKLLLRLGLARFKWRGIGGVAENAEQRTE